MLRKVRSDVREKTGGRQRTGNYDQLESEIYLAGQGVVDRSSDIAMGTRETANISTWSEDNFVLVRGGTFLMGSSDGDDLENPEHNVTVSSFYIGIYEVTRKEYLSVIDRKFSYPEGDNIPVRELSWYDAVEYCNTLSRKEGLAPCYSGRGDSIKCNFNANGYRLPTEAEWEYAAKGGQLSRSYTYSGSSNIEDVAWSAYNSGFAIHPVGRKQANELGIYDMSGNAPEWCWDWYGSYSTTDQTNPSGPPLGSGRVFRGGSYMSSKEELRTVYRSLYDPADKSAFVGFRIVRRL